MMKRPLPRTSAQWLDEIKLAIDDAREAEPFGRLIGQPVTDASLFHLAPLVCLKFRGRKLTGREADRVTTARSIIGSGAVEAVPTRQPTWSCCMPTVIGRSTCKMDGQKRPRPERGVCEGLSWMKGQRAPRNAVLNP
jgi:hypothetical protein